MLTGASTLPTLETAYRQERGRGEGEGWCRGAEEGR